VTMCTASSFGNIGSARAAQLCRAITENHAAYARPHRYGTRLHMHSPCGEAKRCARTLSWCKLISS